MTITREEINGRGIKFILKSEEKIIGRAYLYILHNDLHQDPFGFIEDVFVEDEYRGQGLGTKMINQILDKARELGCYKTIMTSRYSNEKVHKLYASLGFEDRGKEFRLNLKNPRT